MDIIIWLSLLVGLNFDLNHTLKSATVLVEYSIVENSYYINKNIDKSTENEEATNLSIEELQDLLEKISSKKEDEYLIDKIFRQVISVILLVAALYVLLSTRKFNKATEKWATGLIGLILGFWLS